VLLKVLDKVLVSESDKLPVALKLLVLLELEVPLTVRDGDSELVGE
jgi:hypothetical protein